MPDDFTYRLGCEDDVDACMMMLDPGFVVSSETREKMPSIWRRLIESDDMWLAVAEHNGQIVAFGTRVFVKSDFARKLDKATMPFIGARVVESCYADNGPVLGASEICKMNALGLLIMVLHTMGCMSE